jgi:hypothetical protein
MSLTVVEKGERVSLKASWSRSRVPMVNPSRVVVPMVGWK